jgi:hypothetical protein
MVRRPTLSGELAERANSVVTTLGAVVVVRFIAIYINDATAQWYQNDAVNITLVADTNVQGS